MLDNSLPPDQVLDSMVDVAPHEVPKLIWSHIETYFENKYGIEVVDNYPEKNVSKPTITWNLVRRTPGRDGSAIHGKGANFARFLKRTPEGFVHEIYIQQQTIYYEFSVFTVSTSLAEEIIWNLEQAILEVVGLLQSKIEGFQLVLDQQTLDTSMLWRQQDELVRRTVRFEVLLPVKYVRVVPELKYIEINQEWGRVTITNFLISRSTSDKNFYIPVETGQTFTGFCVLYLASSDGWKPLELNTDFKIRRDSNRINYIEWQDDYGLTPDVGQQFRIDYEIAQLTIIRTLNSQSQNVHL